MATRQQTAAPTTTVAPTDPAVAPTQDYNPEGVAGEATPFAGAPSIFNDRINIMRAGMNTLGAGQTDPFREAMKGGVRSANPSKDIYSTREDLAREAFLQLQQSGQLGQFADSPWIARFARQGPMEADSKNWTGALHDTYPGDTQSTGPHPTTPWGEIEDIQPWQMEHMGQERSRIERNNTPIQSLPGEGDFGGQLGANEVGMNESEFYEQFPWMRGPENDPNRFYRQINPLFTTNR